MTREQITSVVRHVLSAVGGVLLAYGIGSEGLIQECIGALMGIFSTVWSVVGKDFSIRMVEGAVRQTLTALSGFMAVNTILTPDVINSICTLVVTIVVTVWGQSDKIKTPQEEPSEPTG